MKKVLLLLVLVIIIAPILVLGFLGYVPGLSNVMGANKPKDLGIKYTPADYKTSQEKSKVARVALSEKPTDPSKSLVYSGSHDVKSEFTSSQITASLNSQNWVNWPYKNMQVKFNADGTTEVSGVLIKSKVPGYAAYLGIPKEVVDIGMKFIPPDPAFYVKGKAALINNKVSLFEPSSFQLGKLSLPVNMFLSFSPNLTPTIYAEGLGELSQKLSEVQNKKAIIIDFINQRITTHEGFFAKDAHVEEDKLIFDGKLPDKISVEE